METNNLKEEIESHILYYQLLRIRMIEEAIADRYSEQKMRCPTHLSIGQEAIAVGVCHHLEQSDYLISGHRGHAHYLAKGGSLKKMLAEIHGKESGCTGGRGGSMHLIDLEKGIVGTTSILAGSIPVGVGVSFATALKNEENITAIFFGEAATEEGVWAECLNFAALKKLPVLFVCENNFYSCYSPMEVRQPPERSRVSIAEAHGIQAFQSPGNELEAVSALSKKGVDLLREGEGPVFLEFDTYRYREHCGPNVDPDGYRPPDEVTYWENKCPLLHYETYLEKTEQITKDQMQEMEVDISKEIEEAFAFAEASDFPEFNLSEKNTYG